MDRADRASDASIRDMLGLVMTEACLSELDVVALLTGVPAAGLARGQVGTVVEVSSSETALVEFSDDEGRAYALVPCSPADLLVLHYAPEAAL